MDRVLIAYIPAIHRGYIDFFTKYPDALYILDTSLVSEVPRLERDIRAIAPLEAKAAIEALGIFKSVKILTKDNMGEVQKTKEIVMPDEDVSHAVAEKYFQDKKVHFAPTFLRWDKLASVKKYNVSPDTEISDKQFDKDVMSKAFAESKKSMDWWRQIGAILVKDGNQISKGNNRHMPAETNPNEMGDPRSNFDAGERIDLSTALHAEAGLIAEAAKAGQSLEGASIYVTTFPCPNCAKLIATSGIKKVYFSDGYSLLDAEAILKGFEVKIVRVKKENTSEGQ